MANPLRKMTALIATPALTAAAQPAAANNPGQATFGQVALETPALEAARAALIEGLLALSPAQKLDIAGDRVGFDPTGSLVALAANAHCTTGLSAATTRRLAVSAVCATAACCYATAKGAPMLHRHVRAPAAHPYVRPTATKATGPACMTHPTLP